MDEIGKWLISSVGNAFAGWGGVLISLIGFWFTYRAARASKLAAEHAFQAITNIDVLQDIKESSVIIENLVSIQLLNANPWVLWHQYTAVIKLLTPLVTLGTLLEKEEHDRLRAILLNCKLAQEECVGLIRDKKYPFDHELLYKLLVENSQSLLNVHTLLRKRIGEDYGRKNSYIGQEST